MANKPKISIIIPVYNVEKYLEQCLKSVINQTFKDIEIICINDGSTDNSLEILEAFQKQDERIKIINKQNEGQGIAKEELPYLFDPLYQVDRARNKKETIGTGLGLSIAKKLIEMHGGTISVHTKENIGVCFICTLPKIGEDER